MTASPAPRPAFRLQGAGLLIALGITQIVSWGSMYYLSALLLQPLQAALALPAPWVVGAFSVSLLVSGLAAPAVGRAIDRRGGRRVMTFGSVAAVLLLAWLSRVDSAVQLYLIYLGLGAAMAATLYPPAFAVVTQAFGTGYRRAITALTLFGGFASTVFWPLTTALIDSLGWRDAVLVLAGINLLLCVPLHALLPSPPVATAAPAMTAAVVADRTAGEAVRTPGFVALAIAFACHALIITAISVYLISLLVERGLSPSEAALVGSLIGPMQVAGRLAELALSHRIRAAQVGLVVAWLLPLSMALLIAAGEATAIGIVLLLFAAAYGIGNGTMTIVRGAVPVELFGRRHYGEISGALNLPSMLAGAAAPFIASLLLAAVGSHDRLLGVLLAVGAIGAASFTLAVRRAMPLSPPT